MPIHEWQEQTDAMKRELTEAISSREATFESTFRNYLCLNNLKSKLARLTAIDQILGIEKYTLAFVGTISKGKTTAICHLFDLVGEFKASKTVAGKTKSTKETQELLATGSGRRTICEVLIKSSDQTYLEIEPYSHEEMETMILDFCESLSDAEDVQGEQKGMVSKEIDTAIRNVIQLNKESVTTTDGDKHTTTRIDRAKEELEKSGLDGLKAIAIRNANLGNRTETTIPYEGDGDERTWIKQTFAHVNDGELSNVAIPRRIHMHVGKSMLSRSPLSRFQMVVDTKGLDENPIRKDLEDYISRDDTICLFVTSFGDAPENNITELMRYYLSAKSRDFPHRFVTLVLPRKGDTEKINGGDGTWEVGTAIRREDIQAAFHNLNLDFFPENILFYDALRCYQPGANVLDTEIYSPEDVARDRKDCLDDILAVIQRRQTFLLEEVTEIGLGFQRIKEGELLTDEQVRAVETAVEKIRDLRDLGKRLPSFVYEEFVERYVTYYRNTYKAWNTKDAINRGFGRFVRRELDIYFDARVVAQGKSNEEMLRKFTKDSKAELESILLQLAEADEALNAFVPDLVKHFNSAYDEFIAQVGNDVEEFVRGKLSPLSADSDFWHALISEKGKVRSRGETYTDNVCQTYRRELQSDTSLNAFLETQSKLHWDHLVSGLLTYFGESST